jgi:glucose-6-phosphate 1-epimerase
MPDRLIAELREKFEIENIVGFDLGNGSLPRVVITAAPAEAHVYLHGAHVTHYRRRGHAPLLFTSARSNFLPDKPIRGGVPICWPWFGPRKDHPQSPMHGFARLQPWTVDDVQAVGRDVRLTLSLKPTDLSRSLWNHDFELKYTVTVGAALDLSLEVRNTGTTPFSFEEALHTYFAVSDIRNTELLGLGESPYTTKVGQGGTITQPPDPLRFTAETDSVYTDNTAPCTIVDRGEERQTVISKENSRSTVVWNPWTTKAKALPDFGDDEWPRMLCVESCNVWHNAIPLRPNQTHAMRQHIESHRLNP